MQFGLIHYNQPDLETFGAFLEFAGKTGFTSVELFLEDFWPAGNDEPEKHAERVRGQIEAAGLTVCAITSENDFVYLDEENIQREVARMERVCRLATIVGTDVLRT